MPSRTRIKRADPPNSPHPKEPTPQEEKDKEKNEEKEVRVDRTFRKAQTIVMALAGAVQPIWRPILETVVQRMTRIHILVGPFLHYMLLMALDPAYAEFQLELPIFDKTSFDHIFKCVTYMGNPLRIVMHPTIRFIQYRTLKELLWKHLTDEEKEALKVNDIELLHVLQQLYIHHQQKLAKKKKIKVNKNEKEDEEEEEEEDDEEAEEVEEDNNDQEEDENENSEQ